MKKNDRHALIIHEVEVHNRVLLTDLANAMQVSPDTIRRDIKELDERQLLKKVHGGAVSNNYKIGSQNTLGNTYAVDSKIKIAQKALPLIKNGSVVLISGGTTNLELIRHLPDKIKATFFTPSLKIAAELLAHPEIEVILIGGKMSKESEITVGGSALHTLSEIKVDVCFLGTGYLDPVYGLTEFDWEVVQMKKAMIQASKKVVSLTISEKLNSQQRYKICGISSIHTLVTELAHDHPLFKPYKEQGVEIK